MYGKRTKLEKKFAYSNITNSNGTEVRFRRTNPTEQRVRFSKDNRTRPKRSKGSLISPCSLTFGERAHQKKVESDLDLPRFEVAVLCFHEITSVGQKASYFGHFKAITISGAFAQTTTSWQAGSVTQKLSNPNRKEVRFHQN